MTDSGSTTYAYNANGEMTSKTAGTITTRYAYDYEGNLTKAGTVTYARDPFGRASPPRRAPPRPTTSSTVRRPSGRRRAPTRRPSTPGASVTS